jgi:hypothetical protein
MPQKPQNKNCNIGSQSYSEAVVRKSSFRQALFDILNMFHSSAFITVETVFSIPILLKALSPPIPSG